jgi:hypothetical protein
MAGYLDVQSRPVRVSRRTSPPFEATGHAVAIELNLVQPRRAVRSLFDEHRQPGRNEAGRRPLRRVFDDDEPVPYSALPSVPQGPHLGSLFQLPEIITSAGRFSPRPFGIKQYPSYPDRSGIRIRCAGWRHSAGLNRTRG